MHNNRIIKNITDEQHDDDSLLSFFSSKKKGPNRPITQQTSRRQPGQPVQPGSKKESDRIP